MPLTERDPNVAGRTSRASTLSSASKGLHKSSQQLRPDVLSTAPGVMSMLKTSTELGDLGTFANSNSSRPPPMTRQSYGRRVGGPGSRPSSSLSRTHASKHGSHHQNWPSVSSAYSGRQSAASNATGNRSVTEGVPSSMAYMPGSSPFHKTHYSRDIRSYSMTHSSKPLFSRSNTPSVASLRSYDSRARPRSPLMYPTRLRRHGYRSASPALSDVTGLQPRTLDAGYVPNGMVHNQYPTHHMDRSVSPYHQVRTRSSHPIMTTPNDAPPMPTLERKATMPERMPHIFPRMPNLSRPSLLLPSEFPSSTDASSVPSTPGQDSSLEVMVSPRVGDYPDLELKLDDSETIHAGGSYYDYSEHFQGNTKSRVAPANHKSAFKVERKSLPTTSSIPKHDSVPTGLVSRIKNILDQRSYSEPLCLSKNETPPPEAIENGPSESMEPVELPASPVPLRITRELVLSVIEPISERTEPSSMITIEDKHASTESKNLPSDFPSTIECKVALEPAKTGRAIELELKNANAEVVAISAKLTGTGIEKDTSKEARTNYLESGDNNLIDEVKTVTAVHTPPLPLRNPARTTVSAQSLVAEEGDPTLEKDIGICRVDCNAEPTATETRVDSSAKERSSVQKVTQKISVDRKTNRYSKSCPALEVQSPTATAEIDVPLKDDRVTDLQVGGSHDANISRKRDSNSTTHLSWNPRRSFALTSKSARSSLALEKPVVRPKGHDVSTTDLRLSGLRTGSNYLPDLKEESQEGSSITTSRRTSIKLPARKSSLAHTSVYGKPMTKTNSGLSYLSKSSDQQLAEARELPSLNFSRIDLVARLNEALGSKSAPDLGSSTQHIGLPSSTRPYHRASSVSMREKYKSFFASLEGLEHSLPEAVQAAVRFSIEKHARQSYDVSETRSLEDVRVKTKSIEVPKRGYSIDVLPQFTSLSADDIMAEITKLSIPSVSGLTQRLSEWMPSLAKYCNQEELAEEAIDHALEDIRGLGRPKIGQFRSSARLRPLPGKSELVVVEDELYAQIRKEEGEAVPDPLGSRRETRDSTQRAPVCELEAPSPAHCRTRTSLSPTEDDENPFALEAALPPKPSESHRSSPDGRPWNQDRNYPWGGSMPDIDIALPHPTATRSTSRVGPSRLRNHISQASLSSETHQESGKQTSPIDTGKIIATETSDPFNHATPKQPARGISTPLHYHFDTAGYANSADALGFRDHHRAVDPGDRYPTTGLTPPSALNIEEVRSFFSDDSSYSRRFVGGRRRRGGIRFRRRLMSFRRPPTNSALPAEMAAGESTAEDRVAPSDIYSDAETGSLHDFGGTGGMSRAEFCARILTDGARLSLLKVGDAVKATTRTLCGLRRGGQHDEGEDSSGDDASEKKRPKDRGMSRRERERQEMEEWLETGTDAVEQAEVAAVVAAQAKAKTKAKAKKGEEKEGGGERDERGGVQVYEGT